jgi:hypothetical protein
MMKHLLFSFSLLFLFVGHCFGQSFVDGVQVTTTKAPWTMRILGNDLDITGVQAKPDEASAYFMMTSESTKLNVSVFIEPVDKCKSGEECRDHLLNLGNPAWGKFEQLSKGKIKDFSYFEFYRAAPQGMPLKMLDMYAEYVSDGYWVDIHISKALYTKADHALFDKVINSIVFTPRKGAAATEFDAQLVKSGSAAASWLGLWDNHKCKESYAALSPLTRTDVGETAWFGYCLRTMQELGPNKSRKLIAAAYARAVPAKTDRPLAVLAYHSTFENQPTIVELTAMMLEKNGSWSVTNYLTQ